MYTVEIVDDTVSPNTCVVACGCCERWCCVPLGDLVRWRSYRFAECVRMLGGLGAALSRTVCSGTGGERGQGRMSANG